MPPAAPTPAATRVCRTTTNTNHASGSRAHTGGLAARSAAGGPWAWRILTAFPTEKTAPPHSKICDGGDGDS